MRLSVFINPLCREAVENIYTEDLQLQKQVICDKKIEKVMFFEKFFVPGAVKALTTFPREKNPIILLLLE